MLGKDVSYKGNHYTVVSAETLDRWWISNADLDEPILVEESEIELNEGRL